MGPRLTADDALAAEIAELRTRRWLLVGIGNDMRGDDAFGPLLARRLLARGLPALDAGTAPENLTGPIRRASPDVLILADAADFAAEPGTLRLLRPFDLADGATSTHDPSLRILLGYLTAERPIDVAVLAAQPAGRELGEAPGARTLAAIEAAAALFGAG